LLYCGIINTIRRYNNALYKGCQLSVNRVKNILPGKFQFYFFLFVLVLVQSSCSNLPEQTPQNKPESNAVSAPQVEKKPYPAQPLTADILFDFTLAEIAAN